MTHGDLTRTLGLRSMPVEPWLQPLYDAVEALEKRIQLLEDAGENEGWDPEDGQ